MLLNECTYLIYCVYLQHIAPTNFNREIYCTPLKEVSKISCYFETKILIFPKIRRKKKKKARNLYKLS